MDKDLHKTFIEKRLAEGLQDIKEDKIYSFADLFGVVKTAEKPNHKKLRKQFEQHIAKKKIL
jgi:hypothetical protein